jgi:hypothetical protein
MTTLTTLDFKAGDVIQIRINDKPVFTVGPEFHAYPKLTFTGKMRVGIELDVAQEEEK